MRKKPEKTEKKLALGVAIIIILILCLAVSTVSLITASIQTENNRIKTGKVVINLNDGFPVINSDEFLFEPGMTVQKEFFIENPGTGDVWYRLYFTNISGGLADIIDVSILNGEDVLYQGKMTDLIFDDTHTPSSTDEALAAGEKRTLLMDFHFPEDSGTEGMNAELCFDLVAEAVQVKNNPDRDF